MSTVTVDTKTLSDSVNAETTPDFGQGRYSPLMQEIYKDSQNILRLTPAKAEKLARNLASAVGDIMKHCPVEVKVGAADKNGKMTIAEAAKLKNVTATEPIRILRAIQYANDALKNGFLRNSTKWTLVEYLQKYIDELK